MEKPIEAIESFIKTIAKHMNLECRVDVREEEKPYGRMISASLFSPQDGRFLIGKNGQNLQAFEYLVRIFCARKIPDIAGVILDINDYRRLKAQQALEIARQAVLRVRATQKAEALVPMSAYERRVVHMELAACTDIATESIGEEPNRRVVVKPFSLDL